MYVCIMYVCDQLYMDITGWLSIMCSGRQRLRILVNGRNSAYHGVPRYSC